MGWDGPILTDSGGFQVFSLAARNRITDQGVTFRSHIDGRLLELTPERAVAIQEALGADVAMCLDHCPALPASRDGDRPGRRPDHRLGRALQGGPHPAGPVALRHRPGGIARRSPSAVRRGPARARFRWLRGRAASASARAARRCGGPSTVTTHLLPADRPRYLMGVGRPQDILDAVATGIDLFDCVMPTRNGRNATCFTDKGLVKLRNAAHARDPRPIEEGCECLACRRFSRAYLRHLFLAKEMLGPILASIHNLTYLHRLTEVDPPGDRRRAGLSSCVWKCLKLWDPKR